MKAWLVSSVFLFPLVFMRLVVAHETDKETEAALHQAAEAARKWA